MSRIFLCDDDSSFIEEVESYIKRYATENKIDIDVVSFTEGIDILKSDISSADILFLDISMRETDGMEIARRIRQNGCEVIIIFLTTMVQYAIEGYEVHAFGFIKKPITYELFARRLKEVLAYSKKRNGTTLKLTSGSNTVYIPSGDIIYIDVLKHQLEITTKTTHLYFTIPISTIESMLNDLYFFRSHKSFIINLKEIRSFGKEEIVMTNGDVVPLSKRRKTDFLKALSVYAGDSF